MTNPLLYNVDVQLIWGANVDPVNIFGQRQMISFHNFK